MKDSISIDLMLTDRCNFRCKYCYEKDMNYCNNNISAKVVEKSISLIRKLSEKRKITLLFWGGEPTLENDYIIYITEILKDISDIEFVVITNGYDLEKLKPYLIYTKNINFHVQVSYDFLPNQDISRLTVTGKKTSEKVKENILWLAKNNINFSIKSTISLDNLVNLFNVYLDFRKLNQEISKYKENEINLSLTFDTNNKVDETKYNKIKNKFKEDLEQILVYQIQNKIEDDFNWFNSNKNRDLCCISKNMFAIDIDGCLYPCHGAVFSKNKELHKYKYNIFSLPKNINNLFRKYIYPDDKKCGQCDSHFCLKCNIHNFDKSLLKNYTKKLTNHSCDKLYCEIMKTISQYKISKNIIKMNI